MEFQPRLEHIEKQKLKHLWVFFLSNLINGVAFSMFNVVYQPFIYQTTHSEILLSLFVGIGMVFQFLPMPFSGKLSDKYGRKIFSLIGILIMIIGLSSLIFTSGLFFLIIGIIFFNNWDYFF